MTSNDVPTPMGEVTMFSKPLDEEFLNDPRVKELEKAHATHAEELRAQLDGANATIEKLRAQLDGANATIEKLRGEADQLQLRAQLAEITAPAPIEPTAPLTILPTTAFDRTLQDDDPPVERRLEVLEATLLRWEPVVREVANKLLDIRL